MRLLAITPIDVSAEEVARRQARYDRLSPSGVRVHVENVGSDAPRALETAEDIAASEAALLDRYAAVGPTDYDAFLPDCVLDPVLDHAASLPVPVHGIGRLTAHYLAGLGMPAGAVARNQAIAAELDRRLEAYGLGPAVPTAVMDLSVDDIADEATWAAAVERTVAGLGARAVINACSAVDVTRDPRGPVLVDPTATALRMLATLAEVAR